MILVYLIRFWLAIAAPYAAFRGDVWEALFWASVYGLVTMKVEREYSWMRFVLLIVWGFALIVIALAAQKGMV